MRIALTGGVACGKSAASALLAQFGFSVISTDTLAHTVLDAPETASPLREAFGDRIFNPASPALPRSVNRPALAAIVFADATARARLEDIVIPEVNRRWRTQTDAEPDKTWFVEVPLLFEKNLAGDFAHTVCIHCARDTQLLRMAARGLDAAEAAQRLNAQLPLEEKIRRADFCLFNNGSLSFLNQQVRELLQKVGVTSR